MPYPSETFIGAFTSALQVVGDELRHFYAQLIGYLNIEHDEDGHHTAITADSIAVSGDVTSEQDGRFGGNVTALAEELTDATIGEVTIGDAGTIVTGTPWTGIHLTREASGSLAHHWAIGFDPNALAGSSGLVLVDVDNLLAATSILKIVRDSATITLPAVYTIEKTHSTVTPHLGRVGNRWGDVIASNVDVALGTVTAATYAGGQTGPWTPVDASGAGLTFTSAVGEYTKLCDMVFFTFQVIYPATASGAAAIIGGLPFAANANNHVASQGFGVPYLQWLLQGTSVIPLSTATSGNVTNAALTGADFVVSGFYKV